MIYTLIFGILFFLIRHLIKTHVTEGIYSLNASLSGITGGDLETGADFRETIELDSLSDGINYTVERLKELIREAEGRIDAELALAAPISNRRSGSIWRPWCCLTPEMLLASGSYHFKTKTLQVPNYPELQSFIISFAVKGRQRGDDFSGRSYKKSFSPSGAEALIVSAPGGRTF